MRTITLIAILSATMSVCFAQGKTYILVHGAWHGAWCWKKVVPLLEAKGNKAIAIDLPGHGNDKTPTASVTFNDYINKVVNEANLQPGEVILVGHSMAGVVIAQAAEQLGPKKVSRLVFLDAFMPANGESLITVAGKVAAGNTTQPSEESLVANLVLSEDQKTSTIKRKALRHLFYHDCSTEDVAFAEERVGAQPVVCISTPVHVTAERYGVIPKYYILCTLAKDLDKSSIAENVPVKRVYKLESSHSPFFSMPDKLTEMIVTP